MEKEITSCSSQMNLLARENYKLTEANNRLANDKGTLYAKVATLEANLSAMKDLSLPIKM